MELREIFQILKRRFILIIVIILASLGATYYFTKNSEGSYETSSVLTIQASRENTDQYQYGGYYAIQASELFANTILGWIKSPNLISEIYKNADLTFLETNTKKTGEEIHARKIPPQNIILTATEKDSEHSRKLAESTINLIKEKTNQLALVVNSSANFEIISSELVTTPRKNNTGFSLLIVLIVSLVLSIFLIFLLEYMSPVISSTEKVKRIFGKAPIPIRGIKWRGLANPETKEAEKFRFLRSNILTPGENEKTSIIIGGLNEQNTTPIIAANLALSFARSGRKTILVDACFANPTIHDYFGRQNEAGFSEFLFDEDNIEKYLQKTEEKNLQIISSGIKLSYASDTIERADTKKILKEIEKRANVIIINVPALNITSEALPLFASIKKALLVLKMGKTSIATATYVNNLMERTGTEKHTVII